jgi:hypothetical protein
MLFSEMKRKFRESELPPLIQACIDNDIAKVEKLVSRGDVNMIECRDQRGRTPLHLAAYRGNVDMISLLVQYGGNVWTKDDIGNTLMHLCNHVEVIRFLAKQGLSPFERYESDMCLSKHTNVCQGFVITLATLHACRPVIELHVIVLLLTSNLAATPKSNLILISVRKLYDTCRSHVVCLFLAPMCSITHLLVSCQFLACNLLHQIDITFYLCSF